MLKESEKWSLKDCNLRQLKMLNDKLDDYQEKPYTFSEPRKRYVPSPDLRPEAIESLEPHQRDVLMQQLQYMQESGQELAGYHTYDFDKVEENKVKLENFHLYRKKFEAS